MDLDYEFFLGWVLGFELKALCLPGRHSAAWATLPALDREYFLNTSFLPDIVEGEHSHVTFHMALAVLFFFFFKYWGLNSGPHVC
jgi:hypothetical protein